ncbi:hypothetical protein CDEN61S_03206 [Castellaniella denitrificans]
MPGAALEVGEVKKAFDAAGPILKPEREALIIRRLQSDNPGPIPEEAVAAIWRQIISTCRGLESVLTAAFLGPQGSFSEQAAYEHFGHAITGLRCESFDEVFRAVEAGQADVGIVPVENSTEGAVNRSLDLLLNSSLKVLGERTIRIHHNLLTLTGGWKASPGCWGIPRPWPSARPGSAATIPDWNACPWPATPRRRAWPRKTPPARRSPGTPPPPPGD